MVPLPREVGQGQNMRYGRRMLRLLVLFVVGVGAALLTRWLWSVLRRRPHPPTVTVDDRGVTRRTTDGREERVAWGDLVQVSIVTTDEGPFDDDLFFLLQDDDGSGCAVGNAEAEATGLVARLQRLPRFDNEALIQASACAIEAHFVCWQGRPGEGLAAAEKELLA